GHVTGVQTCALPILRAVQLALIGTASFALRVRMSERVRVASMVAFVSGLYVTSAIAGSLRGGMATQPITGLAIAFATATTLPWRSEERRVGKEGRAR